MDTYKNIPPQERDGYIYFLKDVQINKHYSCKDGCSPYFNCCIVPNPQGSFDCTEVVFHVIATSSVSEDNRNRWYMNEDRFLIIGTDGYPYKCNIPCNKIDVIPHHLQHGDNLFKCSKGDIILHFPSLPDGVQVREIVINVRPQLSFTIVDEVDDEFSLDGYRKNGILPITQQSTQQSIVRHGERGLIHDLNLYKTLIFQRFNTHLTSDEVRDIDKKIGEQQSIVQNYFSDDDRKFSPELKDLHNEFKKQAAYLREMYIEKCKAEKERLIHITHITDILNLSPDEFERLCGEVMTKMGYYDVMVTQHSNDKGIDVYGKLDGKIVVAQCKRYRDSVGTPDVQRFIGAMKTSGAEKGIFFTTASFTSEAANMATSSGITLFDKTAFARLLSLHHFVDVEKDTRQPSLWDDEDLPE